MYYTGYYYPESDNFMKLEKNYSIENEKYYKDLVKGLDQERIWLVFPFNTKEENDVLDLIDNSYIKTKEFKSTTNVYLFERNAK